MKKIATKWKCFGLLLTLAFVLCLSGGLREVSADSTTCRVIFANSKETIPVEAIANGQEV